MYTIENYSVMSIPPNRLNTDDTGNPKSTIIGGSQRARISSQSIKRAVRIVGCYGSSGATNRYRHLNLPAIPLLAGGYGSIGVRAVQQRLAKKIMDDLSPDLITRLSEIGVEESTVAEALKTLVAKESGDKQALIYLIPEAVSHELTAGIEEGEKAKEEPARKKGEPSPVQEWLINSCKRACAQVSLDIALNGRMLASAPEMVVDAAVQYAHSYSTHPIDYQADFWVGIDDLQQENNGSEEEAQTGAEMLGARAFNHAVMFAAMNLSQPRLQENLNTRRLTPEQLAELSADYISLWARCVPAGAQNSMLASATPELVISILNPVDGGMAALGNLFTSPVNGNEPGLESAARLIDAVAPLLGPTRQAVVWAPNGVEQLSAGKYVERTDEKLRKLPTDFARIARSAEEYRTMLHTALGV